MYKKEEHIIIDNSSYNFTKTFLDILQNNDERKLIVNILNEEMKLNLEKIVFEKIEKYQGVSEYEFYLIKLRAKTKNGEEKSIFIKNIRKGKIKESLFCICDLTYEKYYKNNAKKLKKISILETKEKTKNVSKVSVKLFEDNLSNEQNNMDIYFIEMSKLLKNKNIKERIGNIEINQKDMVIIGVENIS